MKILLLGKNGQVGWELQRALSPLGVVVALGRDEANFLNPESLREVVKQTSPDWVVNAAAYTAVDKAETDERSALAVNSESVRVLAQESSRVGARFVHYSTDYVYDGTKEGAYEEQDPVNPLSVYGKTKLAGEMAVKEECAEHLILRTSWVFAVKGGNFAKTMLRLAKERDELKVVADQVGAPTSAELIADTTALCIHQLMMTPPTEETRWGTYHLVANGQTSWHEYACHVLQKAAEYNVTLRVKPDAVKPITSEQFPVAAKRPKNSRLNISKIQTTFKLQMPNWALHVDRLVDELVSSGEVTK